MKINFDTARQQMSNITSKVGLGKVIGCGCLGCLVPVLSGLVFVIAVGWWLFGSSAPTPVQAQRTPTYSAAAPAQGQLVRPGVPTPVYTPANAQGGIRQGLPSMMGNQPLDPGYLSEGKAAYTPYTGDYSVASQQWYLARANFTGERRTPYVKGQTLSNGLTVVTADFDFVLLQDANGAQWFCDPTGVNCQWWR